MNTPEETAIKFLKAWKAKNWHRMKSACQQSWIEQNPEKVLSAKERREEINKSRRFHRQPELTKYESKKIKGKLKTGALYWLIKIFEQRRLLEYNLGEKFVPDELNAEIIYTLPVWIKEMQDKQIIEHTLLFNVIREKDSKPDKNGVWGVNPVSILRKLNDEHKRETYNENSIQRP